MKRLEMEALGRYHVRGRIGRGTMGIVYRGFDPVLEREVALKTVDLPPAIDEERRRHFLARFFQEAKIAAKLLHPGIVVTHDASTDEATGIPFIAMELVSGGSLGDRIATEGRLSWQEALRVVIPLARALDYAHRQGVVHRDIKPANVLLAADGTPKLADFGIAKLSDSELTQTGAVLGTPYYMSPEQLEADEVDGRSDLFSLGALLYTLVVGEPPFRGPDLATITRQVLYKSPDPPSERVSGVPQALDGALARMLAKDPQARYGSGTELADDLERVGRGEAPLGALSLGESTIVSRKKDSVPSPPAAASEEEKPRSGVGILVVLALALAMGAGALRFEELSRYLFLRVSDAEAAIRETRAESERRNETSARAVRSLDEARGWLSRGEWDRAESALEESLRLAREANDGVGEAAALLWRGRLNAERGDWSRARADLESAASVFDIYDAPAGAARAIVERAHLERDLGELERAEALYESLERGDSVEFELAHGRALLHMVRGDAPSAEREFRSALERADSAEERARATMHLAGLAFALGKIEEAEKWWQQAREDTDPHRVDLFRAYAALASGRADESRALFERAAAHFRELDDRVRLASALEGLSGRMAEGALRTVFLGEPRTERNEELRNRLPPHLEPPSM